MSVQRFRMREILAELKRRGVFTVVGGPWVTVQEDYFGDLADVIFIGEAEETWPQFLERVGGRAVHQPRYEQAEKTDMTQGADAALRPAQDAALRLRQRAVLARLPVPVRVLRHHRHLRPPAAAQDRAADHRRAGGAARRRSMRIVFIVDDNLIGNKKAIKEVLRDVIAWQERARLPADLLHRGVARPGRRRRADAADGRGQHRRRLHRHREPQRGVAARDQEVPERPRRAARMLERVHRIQDAGMEVWCGMILGFDNDDATIFDAQRQFLDARRGSSTPWSACCRRSPRRRCTPGWPRRAGSTRPTSRSSAPTSSRCSMSREELRDGYVRVMGDLYEPEAYFDRVDAPLPRRPHRHRPRLAELCATSILAPRGGARSRSGSRRSACSLRDARQVPDRSLRASTAGVSWRLLGRGPSLHATHLCAQMRHPLAHAQIRPPAEQSASRRRQYL